MTHLTASGRTGGLVTAASYVHESAVSGGLDAFDARVVDATDLAAPKADKTQWTSPT